MHQPETTRTTADSQSTWAGIERQRVEKVVETLAALGSRGESLSAVAHDARNMVAALTLYCDLLQSPGVLAPSFAHYAQELRLVAAASRRLVEKLIALDASALPELLRSQAGGPAAPAGEGTADARPAMGSAGVAGRTASPRIVPWPASGGGNTAANSNRVPVEDRVDHRESERRSDAVESLSDDRRGERIRRGNLLTALPIADLGQELTANGNLLAALAGSSIALTIETDGNLLPVRLSGEDLTRLLVNLVKNAAEAMAQGGRIEIALRRIEASERAEPTAVLTVEDNGPGLPEDALETIFVSGYTTRTKESALGAGWPQTHRGLGLAIVRSLVAGAGGRIAASNRPQGGACFTIELPVWKSGTGEQGRGPGMSRPETL